MTEIGKYNLLKIVKKVDFGMYLDGEELGEILLPQKYAPQDRAIGDQIKVFIYLDSKDRIIATTQKPYASVGQFAMLRVVSATAIGAFLDWGLEKDLLVPFREQKEKMQQGNHYVVYVYLDKKTNRIAASSKLEKYLGRQEADYTVGQLVDLLIAEQTDLGYYAIINNSHKGLLYKDRLFRPLKIGQRVSGVVEKIRMDGKIDLSLQKAGYEKVDELSGRILARLEKSGGRLELTDKTPPETIYKLFGVSKKTFKKALGGLYKKRMIVLENSGIRLIKRGI